MSKREKIKLPSGAHLHVQVASFSVSKSLYQAVLEEAKGISFKKDLDVTELIKTLICVGFSSKKIEEALLECFKVCTIDFGKGEMKIDDDYFESVERRDDYFKVCLEIAKANVLPFVKSLYADYESIMKTILNSPM